MYAYCKILLANNEKVKTSPLNVQDTVYSRAVNSTGYEHLWLTEYLFPQATMQTWPVFGKRRHGLDVGLSVTENPFGLVTLFSVSGIIVYCTLKYKTLKFAYALLWLI